MYKIGPELFAPTEFHLSSSDPAFNRSRMIGRSGTFGIPANQGHEKQLNARLTDKQHQPHIAL